MDRLPALLLCGPLALAGCWMGASVGSAGDGGDDDDDTGGGITDPDTNGQGEWVLEELESPTAANLSDVWGSTWNDVWAVGENGVILHYDGAAWSLADTSAIPEQQTLFGIGGRSASDVVAVGAEAQVLVFDGMGWLPSPVSAPGPGPLPALRAVCVSPGGHIWIVGDAGTWMHSGQGPNESNLVPGGPDLHGVHCLQGGDAYFVGHDHTAFASSVISYMQIYDWSVHEMDHEKTDNMYALDGDQAFDTWAAGFVDGEGSNVYRLVDGGWAVWETSPHELLDLHADSDMGLWAAGNTSDEGSTGVVQAWQGGAPIFEQEVPSTSRLRGIWVAPDGDPRQVLAVGKGGVIVSVSWQAW